MVDQRSQQVSNSGSLVDVKKSLSFDAKRRIFVDDTAAVSWLVSITCI